MIDAAVRREPAPLNVHVTGETPAGRAFRWSRDATDPADRPSGLRWSDTMPGGFDRFGCTLPRKPGLDYSDLQSFSTLTVRGAGGEILGEYRLERAPRASGDQMSVSPDAVGWQAHLEDDRTASTIIIDRDLGRWQGPGTQRQAYLRSVNYPPTGSVGPTWDTAAAGPGLLFDIQGAWASPVIPLAETWYDAGASNRIARVSAAFSGISNTNFVLNAAVSAAAATSGGGDESTGDVYSVTSGSFDFTPAARFRYALIQWAYASTPGGTDGASHQATLKSLRVHGDHGLALQTPAGADAGYLASDIVAYVVGRWAPLLRFRTGINGTIQPSSFVIPQAAYVEQTTASAILQDVSAYELPEWAVWDRRTFWYHPPGFRGRRWCARVAPSGLEETGPQADRVWNGILVQFQDVDGSTRTVGPPGSGADVESAQLLDLDSENPANQLNARRWDLLSMGRVSTPAAAIVVGALFLKQARQLSTTGTARFVGYIEDDRGNLWPYHKMRSGDTVVFVDAADRSPRRIVQTEKDDEAHACTATLDSPSEAIGALLARMGLAIVPLGF